MPIKDLARSNAITANPNASVPELAQRMRDQNVGSVIVTNDNITTGIVTDRDLVTRVLAEEAQSSAVTASDIMSMDVCSISPDAGVYEAAQMMSENGVRRLPICGEQNELIGIITADDLTELLADESQQLAAVIQAQRSEYRE